MDVFEKIKSESYIYESILTASKFFENTNIPFDCPVGTKKIEIFIKNQNEQKTFFGFADTQDELDNSKLGKIAKLFVEWLGDCLAIDCINLTYNRLEINNQIIELDN